jgi:hypothetical protein
MTLSITMLCHSAECHVSIIIMLNINMLSVIILIVILLSDIILNGDAEKRYAMCRDAIRASAML